MKQIVYHFHISGNYYAGNHIDMHTGLPYSTCAPEMYDESRMASGTTNIENGIQCRDNGQSKRKEAKEKKKNSNTKGGT